MAQLVEPTTGLRYDVIRKRELVFHEPVLRADVAEGSRFLNRDGFMFFGPTGLMSFVPADPKLMDEDLDATLLDAAQMAQKGIQKKLEEEAA